MNEALALLLKLLGVTLDPAVMGWGVKAFNVIAVLVDEEKREDALTVMIAELRNGKMPTILTRFVMTDEKVVD